MFIGSMINQSAFGSNSSQERLPLRRLLQPVARASRLNVLLRSLQPKFRRQLVLAREVQSLSVKNSEWRLARGFQLPGLASAWRSPAG